MADDNKSQPTKTDKTIFEKRGQVSSIDNSNLQLLQQTNNSTSNQQSTKTTEK